MAPCDMLPVLITIDTEYSSSLYRKGPGRDRAFNFDRTIACRGSKGEVGIHYQMEVMSRHGIKGVFFVDPMPALVWGQEAVDAIVHPILQAGHEVQLHCHTEWLGFAKGDPFGPERGKNLKDFTLDTQSAILEYARDRLVEAGAQHPGIFRAGNYGANDDTLRALASIRHHPRQQLCSRYRGFALRYRPALGPMRTDRALRRRTMADCRNRRARRLASRPDHRIVLCRVARRSHSRCRSRMACLRPRLAQFRAVQPQEGRAQSDAGAPVRKVLRVARGKRIGARLRDRGAVGPSPSTTFAIAHAQRHANSWPHGGAIASKPLLREKERHLMSAAPIHKSYAASTSTTSLSSSAVMVTAASSVIATPSRALASMPSEPSPTRTSPVAGTR